MSSFNHRLHRQTDPQPARENHAPLPRPAAPAAQSPLRNLAQSTARSPHPPATPPPSASPALNLPQAIISVARAAPPIDTHTPVHTPTTTYAAALAPKPRVPRHRHPLRSNFRNTVSRSIKTPPRILHPPPPTRPRPPKSDGAPSTAYCPPAVRHKPLAEPLQPRRRYRAVDLGGKQAAALRLVLVTH